MSWRSHHPSDGGFLGNDRFQVERKLGEGSMGSVYLAYDRERHTQVALKTLRRVDSSGIYRFKREFRTLADLRHENLVQLHDLFAEGDEWYFSMEYVDGEPLLQCLLGNDHVHTEFSSHGTRKLGASRVSDIDGINRPVSPQQDADQLRAVMLQVAHGISFAHSAGRLHRDLKPDNVLVTPDGRAVVLDFGIALELADDGHRTFEAGVMGTPAYMSPEQAAGQPVGEATDWYSFGVILYEALTGTVPFDGNFLELLRIKQARDPLAPSELVSGVPEDLDALCVALLQRDPGQRPSGSEIVMALSSAAHVVRVEPSASPPAFAEVSSGLLGRESQLVELRRALAATDSGRPVVALVQGGTGMGKTALVERFVADLRQDGHATALFGRCFERELLPLKAFDGVLDSLSRHLRAAPTVQVADVMPRDVHALTRLFPVLEHVPVIDQVRRRVPPPQEPDAVRRAGLGALKAMLRRLAEQQPLAVVVDDLQWGDVESARFIASLVSGSACPAMLLLFTYRAGDVQGSPCLRTLFEHTRENTQLDVRQITLSPLSDDDMRALCLRFQGDRAALSAEDVTAIVHEAKGNPYLLLESLSGLEAARSSDDGGMTTLASSLSTRLSELPETARHVVDLLAVSGRPLAERLLSQVADQEAEVLQSCLSLLRSEKMVRGVGTVDAQAIDVYHEGVRKTALAELPEDITRALHRMLADAIERDGARDLQALTDHLIGAHEFKRASTYAIRAALQASRAMYFDRASELFALAVRYTDDDAWRNDLMLQWADALVNAGRGVEAAQVYLDARTMADAEGAHALCRRAGVQLLLSGHVTRGRELMRSSLKEFQVELPEFERDAIAQSFLLHEEFSRTGLKFEQRPLGRIEPARVERFDALWDMGQALFQFDPTVMMPLLLRTVKEALALGHVPRVIPALCAYYMHYESIVGVALGTPCHALKLAEELCHEHAQPRERAYLAMARGVSHLYSGLYRPAVLHLHRAEELFRTRCLGAFAEMRMCRQYVAYLLGVLGQYRDFHLVEQWTRESDRKQDQVGSVHLRLLAVLGALAEDDVERAQRYVAAVESWPEASLGITSLLLRLARARLALYTHDTKLSRMVSDGVDIVDNVYSVPAWRAEAVLQRARNLLFQANLSSEPSLREEAERCIGLLDGHRISHYADHVALCRAALRLLSGDRNGAMAALERILQDGEQTGDGAVILISASIRRGQLLGQRDGRRLVREGLQRLSALGIRSPQNFLRLYAPGFPDLDDNLVNQKDV